MNTQPQSKIKDKLTKTQTFWLDGVIQTLIGLDLIADVLLSENDKGIVITMVPKHIFQDMIAEGDNPLELGLSMNMPAIDPDTSLVELTKIQYSFLRQFVYVLLSYGRELAAVNNNENDNTYDTESNTEEDTQAPGSDLDGQSDTPIFKLPADSKAGGS